MASGILADICQNSMPPSGDVSGRTKASLITEKATAAAANSAEDGSLPVHDLGPLLGAHRRKSSQLVRASKAVL